MKHAFKKVMAFVLTLAMILSVLPSVFAAGTIGPFTDVKDDAWYADYVEYVYDYDLMNGVTETTFDPNGNCTRAMAATVIYRLAGEPNVDEEATFTDLTQNWYKDAIAWAEDEGVVNGVGDNKFNPTGLLSREQLVTMIWRYEGSPKVAEDKLKDFADADKISAYAKDAFNWAIANGIIGGSVVDGKTLLDPKGNATRAQFAKIITVYDGLEPCTHTWDAGVVTTPATCLATGIITYTCTICGATKEEETPIGDHSYVDGICSVCGDELATNDEIVIYYTNDVHTYIDGKMSYDSIADLKTQTEAVAAGVLLVDAGDHAQGTAFGSMDKGAKIIEMMNAAGYDAATLGNHEFDYGMARALEMTEQSDFPYLSANFYHEEAGVPGESVLDAYKIFEVGGKKIALVGITTPESFTKSTPKYFQDDAGNYIYGIAGGDDGAALYASVQAAVDAAKAEGADFVIALGHLGIDSSSAPWTSKEVIANVSGLDAFIDGHSHSTVAGEAVKDKDNKDVILTQTGSYFDAIGKMTIKGDAITTELLTSYAGADATTKGIKDAWIDSVNEQLGEVIGHADVTFDNYVDGTRLVRKQETNTGDFAADALYYLFDVTEGLDVDCAIMNGGGVRNKAVTGDLSYLSCKSIHTFGNVACLQTVTGQQILDALEWGARDVGAAECGGFLQVSGITYEIHSYITSTVQKDDKGVWTAGPTGEYRVKNVKIGGEAIDLAANYNLAGYNYTLRDLGDGFAMFDGAVNVKDYVMEDYMVLANYVKSFPVIGTLPTITAENSEYGDVNGAGRIKIVTEKPITTEKVAIYVPADGKVMTTTGSVYNEKKQLASADATLADGKLTSTATNVALFSRITADGVTTFKTADNKYLSCDGTNVELVDAESDYTKWIVEETTGGYTIKCAIAKSGSYERWLEFYANVFTTYGIGATSDMNDFTFDFYPMGEGEPPVPTEDKVFAKVTEEPTDWEGTYIIVHEVDATNALVFNGQTDSDLNHVAATIADGKITASTDNAIVFAVSGAGYTFKAKGGYLTGKLYDGAPANGLIYSATPSVGSLAWDAEKGAIITSAEGTIFRYNGNAYDTATYSWFRFFKEASSVQTPISLYKMTDETPVDCVHELVKVDAVAATCTAEGNIEYWQCSKCNKLFSDAAATTAITLAATVTDIIDHVDANEDDLCDVCGADLSETPPPAGAVAIFNAGANKLMTTEVSVYNTKDQLKSADATLADGKLTTTATNAALFTISTTDGITTFKTADNKFLYADGTHVRLVDEEGDNTKFVLEEVTGGYYIKCATAQYSGKAQYIEYYSNVFTVYGMGTNTAIYTFNFYPIAAAAACDHANLTATAAVPATCTAVGNIAYWTCADCGKLFSDAAATTEITLASTVLAKIDHVDANNDDLCDVCGEDLGETPPPAGAVAIFNAGANKLMTTEVSVYNTKDQLKSADATLADGKLTTTATNTALFTMTTTDGVTTFKTADNKFLYADGTHVRLVDEEGDNTKFVLEEVTGGYYIKCATAQYSGKAQYIEFYSNVFTVYGMGTNTAIYTFNFYPIEVAAPCTHENLTATAAVAATCTAAGNIAYWTCNDCNKIFSDAAATTEVTSTTVAALGHIDENGDNKCDRCDIDMGTVPAGDKYAKVTTNLTDYAGDYLIVYSSADTNYVYNGVDVTQATGPSYVTADINEDDEITFAEGMAIVRIAAIEGGYSLQIIGGANNGKYLANNTASDNGSRFVDAAALTTISVTDGLATITQDTCIFRFNSSSNQLRFRYYKPTSTSMPLVNLYKLVAD